MALFCSILFLFGVLCAALCVVATVFWIVLTLTQGVLVCIEKTVTSPDSLIETMARYRAPADCNYRTRWLALSDPRLRLVRVPRSRWHLARVASRGGAIRSELESLPSENSRALANSRRRCRSVNKLRVAVELIGERSVSPPMRAQSSDEVPAMSKVFLGNEYPC
jgi:hypothetical protein